MSASINVKKTNRFIDPALYIAFGATGFVFLALIASAFFGKVLFSKNVRVAEEEVVKIEALKLEPQLVGALRIDTKASIPNNHGVVYEIQLLDKQGKMIASATKDAWRESGIWYEDGESGTWNEDDLDAGLDVRAKKGEEVTVAISVLEYENLSGGKARSLTTFSVDDVIGNQANKPKPKVNYVNFDVKITNGVVDGRHLWPGLFGTLALAVMTYIAAPRSGKKVISKTINDSDPSERATLGGADKLVRVKINVTSDETSPRTMQAKLVINDSYGEQLYSETIPLSLKFHREDGKLEKVTGFAQKFFVLETQDSYGFHVEVTPDAPVDRTTLTVIDGNHTRTPVEVVHVS
ncbi:MAG: hypothetical protein SWZ49_21275 [Cyanobacteriota bacterium]|nr:hypothetical protein [Cyanobacteriota bacterium]